MKGQVILKKPRVKPASYQAIAFLWKNQTEYDRLTNALSVTRFSGTTIEALNNMIGPGAALLVESVARIDNYSDPDDCAYMKRELSKLLGESGVHLPPGKRPNKKLEELVEKLAPILIFFNIPSSSSERSRLVVLLRHIACDFDIPGDPRDALRRLLRLQAQSEKNSREAAVEIFLDAFKLLIPPNRNK